MATITLSASGVNGGTAVTIYAASVSYNWKNLIRTDPSPQKFDTVEADTSGWENPIIAIEGSFNVDDLDTNEIRHAHLINFAKIQYDGSSSTAITLTVPTGLGATQTNLLAADASTTTIRVIVDSFQIKLNVGSEMGHIWDFTLTLRETK